MTISNTTNLVAQARKEGIKEGRKQIIRNIKKHYQEDYWYMPGGYNEDSYDIFLPSKTLQSYFKEAGYTEQDFEM
jgi:hypothetical protein